MKRHWKAAVCFLMAAWMCVSLTGCQFLMLVPAVDSSQEVSESSEKVVDRLPISSASQESSKKESSMKESSAGAARPDTPVFETQVYDDGSLTFEIPLSWSQFEGDGSGDYLIFANEDADGESLTSNVNVVYQSSTGKALSLKEMEAQFPAQYEARLKQLYPSVTGFAYSDFEAPIGPVFTVSYKFDMDGKTVNQIQFYPLFDGGMVVVTATMVQDIDVNPADVGKHIVKTLEIMQ